MCVCVCECVCVCVCVCVSVCDLFRFLPYGHPFYSLFSMQLLGENN